MFLLIPTLLIIFVLLVVGGVAIFFDTATSSVDMWDELYSHDIICEEEEDMKDYAKVEFQECPTCAAKTGMPILCDSCLHNRQAISVLKETVNELIQSVIDGIANLPDELKPK